MKTRSALLLAAAFALCASAHAALEKELGQALVYYRVTDAKADLPGTADIIERRPALVLDLRSIVADGDFARALQAALAKTPPPHAARFVLINAATAPAVIEALDADFISVITLGPKSSAIKPDIAVSTTEDMDHKAYAALADGTAVEKLVSDNRDKRRYDEAKLVHDHANGVTPSEAELPADAEDDSIVPDQMEAKQPSEPAKKAESAPVIDVVLERAIQIHRSLLALKKL